MCGDLVFLVACDFWLHRNAVLACLCKPTSASGTLFLNGSPTSLSCGRALLVNYGCKRPLLPRKNTKLTAPNIRHSTDVGQGIRTIGGLHLLIRRKLLPSLLCALQSPVANLLDKTFIDCITGRREINELLSSDLPEDTGPRVLNVP